MITPAQASAMADEQAWDLDSLARQLEHQIDAALIRAVREGFWPASISMFDVPDQIRRRLVSEYARTGWVAKVVLDELDGDYLHIAPLMTVTSMSGKKG